jgi:ABC-type transport system substrate-binding protein
MKSTHVVAGLVVALAVLVSGGRGLAGQNPAPRGELRVVETSPALFAWITFNVFEHLLELDQDGLLVPRLATGWRWIDDRTLEVNLRRGVKFHTGEVFDAEIVKLNIVDTLTLNHPFHLGSFMNFDPGTRVEVLDRYTVRIVTPKPDGAMLARLSFIHMGNRAFFQAGGWGGKHW